MGWMDFATEAVNVAMNPGDALGRTAARAVERVLSDDDRERDNGISTLESGLGVLSPIPVVGEVLGLGSAAYHAGSAIYDGATGDRDGAINHGTQALYNGVTAIPGISEYAGAVDAVAGLAGMQGRGMVADAGGNSEVVPGGTDDALGALAVGLTHAVFGEDDSNWIAPGDTPTGTREGEIRAGTAGVGALVGTVLCPPFGAIAGGVLGHELDIGPDIGEYFGADLDGPTSGTPETVRAAQAAIDGQPLDVILNAGEQPAEQAQPEPGARMEAPRIPETPQHLQDEVFNDRESQTSILANRAGVPMDRLMRLGDDGEWVYDEDAIRAARETVQSEQDQETDMVFTPAEVGIEDDDSERPDMVFTPAEVDQINAERGPVEEPAPAPRPARRRRPRRPSSGQDHLSAGGHLSPSGRWISDDEPGARRSRRRGRR